MLLLWVVVAVVVLAVLVVAVERVKCFKPRNRSP
jgi:beta-lactamase regulating signal transducer with metallopeptidase domain